MRLAGEVFHLVRDDPAVGLDWEFARLLSALLRTGTLAFGDETPEFCRVALDATHRLQRVSETMDLSSVAALGNSMAEVLYAQGDVSTAHSCLAWTVDLVDEEPFLGSLLATSLAQLLRRAGEWEAGIDWLRRAHAFVEDDETPNGWYARAYALGERAQNLIDQGALGPAQLAADEELECARRAGDAESTATAERHRLALALSKGAFELAYSSATELIDGERAEELPAAVRATFQAMGGIAHAELVRRQIPASKLSSAAFRRSRELLDAARSSGALGVIESLRIDLYLVEHALHAGDVERARAELDVARERVGQVSEGLERLEYATLLEALDTRCALLEGTSAEELAVLDAALDAGFDRFLEAWDRGRSSADVAFLHANARRTILGQRIALSLERGAESREGRAEDALEDLLRAHSLGAVARAGNVASPDVAAVRAGLAKGHGLLVFASAPEGGHLFAVDAEGIAHEPLPPEPELWDACMDLKRAVRGATGVGSEALEDELEGAVARGTRTLLPGGARAALARWSQVTIVGGTFLLDVPFELLAGADGLLLGESLAIDAWPTVTFGSALAQRSSPPDPDQHALLLTGLEPGAEAVRRYPSLSAVQLSDSDITALTSAFGEAVDATGRVTPSALRGSDLAKAPVVHLLAHGVYENSLSHAGAALVLEPEEGRLGVFRRDDVRELSLSGVVLLSACEAGRGPVLLGNDHLANLGGAFLDAGARCVVQPREPVRLGEAIALMEQVTRALASGASTAEAVRQARAELGGRDASWQTRARLAHWQVLGLGQEAPLRGR